MKEVDDPWGVFPEMRESLKAVEALVSSLEEGARMVQPLITGSDTAKVLLSLKKYHYSGVLRKSCSTTRYLEHRCVQEQLAVFHDLSKDAKYLLVLPAGIFEELHEFELRAVALRDRIKRVEAVLDMAEEKIFIFARSAAAGHYSK